MASSILIVRPGAIGDALLAFPALASLRQARPGERITFVAHPAVGNLALETGLVDEFVSRDDPLSDALFAPAPTGALKRLQSVAAAVAWTSASIHLRQNLIALGGEPVVVAPSRPEEHSGAHVAQYLIDTLAPFGVCAHAADWIGFERLACPAALPASLASSAGECGLRSAVPIVVLHPGSGSRRKNWPARLYARLGDALWKRDRARILVLIGPADDEARAVFEAEAEGPHATLVERPIEELAALLAHSDLYVGNDSAMSHLAGLSGAPTLAIFGPTDPHLWRPVGKRVQVVRHEPLDGLEVDTVLKEALAIAGYGQAVA